MHATVLYTLSRLLLFVVVFVVIYAIGLRGLLMYALALVISGILSYVVLSRQRDRMSVALSRRLTNFRDRLDEGTRAEDDD